MYCHLCKKDMETKYCGDCGRPNVKFRKENCVHETVWEMDGAVHCFDCRTTWHGKEWENRNE